MVFSSIPTGRPGAPGQPDNRDNQEYSRSERDTMIQRCPFKNATMQQWGTAWGARFSTEVCRRPTPGPPFLRTTGRVRRGARCNGRGVAELHRAARLSLQYKNCCNQAAAISVSDNTTRRTLIKLPPSCLRLQVPGAYGQDEGRIMCGQSSGGACANQRTETGAYPEIT
jgi:hypothetical protein